MHLIKISVALLSFYFMLACEAWTNGEAFDRESFKLSGNTFFAKPEVISIKEIHLDQAKVRGREIIVEGLIALRGSNDTFVVLEDEAARLLVDITKDLSVPELLRGAEAQRVRILGTVETGKKGFPVFSALAVAKTDAG